VRRALSVTVVVLVAAAAAHGCAKKAPATAAPAGDATGLKRADAAAEPEAVTEGLPDDIDAIETRLVELEDQLHGQGLRLFNDDDEAEPAREAGASCDRVCQLAETICDLEGKICDLAERHDGEQRYADACERAEKHCETATAACRDCAG
jgi:hypothetical protein